MNAPLPTAALSVFLSVFVVAVLYQDGTVSPVEMRYLVGAAVGIVIGLLIVFVIVLTDGHPIRFLRRRRAKRVPPPVPPPPTNDRSSGPRPGY